MKVEGGCGPAGPKRLKAGADVGVEAEEGCIAAVAVGGVRDVAADGDTEVVAAEESGANTDGTLGTLDGPRSEEGYGGGGPRCTTSGPF